MQFCWFWSKLSDFLWVKDLLGAYLAGKIQNGYQIVRSASNLEGQTWLYCTLEGNKVFLTLKWKKKTIILWKISCCHVFWVSESNIIEKIGPRATIIYELPRMMGLASWNTKSLINMHEVLKYSSEEIIPSSCKCSTLLGLNFLEIKKKKIHKHLSF